MLSIFFLHYFLRHTAVALPIQHRDAEQLDIAIMSLRCLDLTHCRTTWNIVWSSLLTIFSCTWLAIHPNIPAPNDSFICVKLRRMLLMGVGLLAPELVILWAMRQRAMARHLAELHKDKDWTEIHGFFALMGGFTIRNEDGKQHPFLLSDLHKYLRTGSINISKAEILDRSKGDVLSKGIVLLQTGWFILQLIARTIRRLPISELELVALAFAALNFTTYWVWWYKPLDVKCPVVVKSLVDMQCPMELQIPPVADELTTSVGDPAAESSVTSLLAKGPRINLSRNKFDPFPESSRLQAVLKTLHAVYYNLCDTGGEPDIQDFFTRVQRVPTFYWGFDLATEELYTSFRHSVNGTAVLLATMFGAIHCLAWAFQMPSEAETKLWRITAIFTTVLPLPYTLVMGAFGQPIPRKDIRQSSSVIIKSRYLKFLYVLSGHAFLFLYFVARILLLIQAFMLLRALPAGAFTTVHWTTLIPHI